MSTHRTAQTDNDADILDAVNSTIDESTPIEQLADQGENPAAGSGIVHPCTLEVDVDAHWAVVRWSEDLRWHVDYNGPRTVAEHGYAADGGWPDGTMTDDGWLTQESEGKVCQRLAEILAPVAQGHEFQVEAIEYGGDEPNVTLEVATRYTPGETYGAWFDRIGWPVVATLINVTDPGTFNSPYLFGASTFALNALDRH